MQLTIRVPEHHMRQIEALARKMGLKKSDVARMAIKEYITNHAGDDDGYPFAKAGALLGVAESGIKDLGLNHRKYLVARIRKSRGTVND